MKVEIIAEIGVNANGVVANAIDLIDAAIMAGADTIKLQATFPRIEMSWLLMRERIEMTEKVILTHHQLEQVIDYCRQTKVRWLCTPSEEASLEWLVRQGPDRIKVGSDNLTNIPFLQKVAECRLPVIISTGMGTWSEIREAYYLLREVLSSGDVTVMHCTSSYPCPVRDANLLALMSLREALPMSPRGWSDHTQSPLLACAAVALGAQVIEKHITMDRRLQGPDHAASADPVQFATMVRAIRETEEGLGDGELIPRMRELANIGVVRKSIVAKRVIKVGEQFSPDNIAVMRPGTGRPPRNYGSMMDQRAKRNYDEGELI